MLFVAELATVITWRLFQQGQDALSQFLKLSTKKHLKGMTTNDIESGDNKQPQPIKLLLISASLKQSIPWK